MKKILVLTAIAAIVFMMLMGCSNPRSSRTPEQKRLFQKMESRITAAKKGALIVYWKGESIWLVNHNNSETVRCDRDNNGAGSFENTPNALSDSVVAVVYPGDPEYSTVLSAYATGKHESIQQCFSCHNI